MKKLLLVLGFLTVATAAKAAVVLDYATISGTETAHTGKNQFPITVGTGLNRLFVAACTENLSARLDIASGTVNGSTMTLVHRYIDENGLNQTEFWMYQNPPSGPAQATLFFNGPAGGASESDVECAGLVFENVNVADPIDVSTGVHFTINDTSFETSIVTTVSTAALVDVMVEGSNGDPSRYIPFTDQTLLAENYRTTKGMATSMKQAGLAGAKTMRWDSDATTGAHAIIAIKTSVGSPELTSISPSETYKGVGDVTLTVTGSNYVSGATVTYNGSDLATTFVNSTQLTATIPGASLLTISTAAVTVKNPDTARTAALQFTVTGNVNYGWVTDGGYKPTMDDTYGISNTSVVENTRIWDGSLATPFQAKNEINGFALVLENGTGADSTQVSVDWPVFTHESGDYVISSTPMAKTQLWDFRTKPINMYHVRYLPIEGLSQIQWEFYDEQHVPERFQATYALNGNGQGIRSGGWSSRADHDKWYPDILVPFELIVGSTFTIAASSSQVIWVDVYVPKDAPSGVYTSTITVREGAEVSMRIPINLTVYPFTMPDKPYAKAYTSLGTSDLNRYTHGTATTFQNSNDLNDSKVVTHLRYRQFLHRYGLHTIGDNGLNGGCGTDIYTEGPCNEYKVALNGTLYDPTSGYANAPGIRTPDVGYSYSGWSSSQWIDTEASFCKNVNIWQKWFDENAPDIDHWLYMIDEPSSAVIADKVNRWSTWIKNCPAPGNRFPSMTTAREDVLLSSAPNTRYVATTLNLRTAAERIAAHNAFITNPERRSWHYNGVRPWWGTMITEDDGVAMRVMMWGQFKMKYDKYFIWRSNFWIDTAHGNRNNDLFKDARTFGNFTTTNATFGKTGFQYQNGDGVLIYPGVNTINTEDDYGATDAVFPSWRLQMWRRGIRDFDVLTMASKVNPRAVNAIVQSIIPKVLYEYGVFNQSDPSFQYGPKSWSSDPNVWELAREQLYNIIAGDYR